MLTLNKHKNSIINFSIPICNKEFTSQKNTNHHSNYQPVKSYIQIYNHKNMLYLS